jgi:hypothetical protein
VTRRTGTYLVRRVDHLDPQELTATTVAAVLDVLEELDVESDMSFDEAGAPVLTVDAEAWQRLSSSTTLTRVRADLHVHTFVPGSADRPLGYHQPGWLATTAEDSDKFECFLARCGQHQRSLIGPEFAVTVRASRPWGRPNEPSASRSSTQQADLTDHIRERQRPPFEIDAVFTWVDGDDPTWQRRRDAATGIESIADGAADHRFKSRDELRYALRSILLYAPWIRNVYIVTDDQRPTWLTDHPRIRVVDHREILPPDALPTFNSHVIESALHLVPGLSEHYLYLNDDMLFGAPVRWSDFFTADGTAKFFLSGARIPSPWTELKTIDYANLNAQRLLRDRFQTEIDRKIRHAPYAQRRTVHEWMTTELPDEVKTTRAATTRSATDQSFSSYLHHFVGRELGLASSSRIRSDYFGLDDANLARRLRGQLERRDAVAVLCLNDEDLENGDSKRVNQILFDFLEAAYPFPAPWEVERGPGRPDS